MSEKLKKCTIRINSELWDKFGEICSMDHTNCSEKIRELITMYIDSQNNQSLDEIYKLVDCIVARSGHVTHEAIKRKTNTLQEEKVLTYCQRKGYKVDSELGYVPCPVHKDKDMYGIKYFRF